MEARRSAGRGILLLLRVIPFFLCDSTLMVRPEGAHSELSQKADLTPSFSLRTTDCGSADSAHYAILKPAYGSKCQVRRGSQGFQRRLGQLFLGVVVW